MVAGLGRRTQASAAGLGRELVALAAEESPVGKVHRGQLFSRSWVAEPAYRSTGVEVTLRNTDPKAPLVMGPTAPHRIPASGNTLLAWQGGKFGSGWHFAMHVQHPGTKGNDVLARVSARAQPLYEQAGAELVGGILADFEAAWQ